MDRKLFLEKWRDEFCGILADAHVHHRDGGELSIRIRQSFRKVDCLLGLIHAELYPQAQPPKGPKP